MGGDGGWWWLGKGGPSPLSQRLAEIYYEEFALVRISLALVLKLCAMSRSTATHLKLLSVVTDITDCFFPVQN